MGLGRNSGVGSAVRRRRAEAQRRLPCLTHRVALGRAALNALTAAAAAAAAAADMFGEDVLGVGDPSPWADDSVEGAPCRGGGGGGGGGGGAHNDAALPSPDARVCVPRAGRTRRARGAGSSGLASLLRSKQRSLIWTTVISMHMAAPRCARAASPMAAHAMPLLALRLLALQPLA
jgi:hypothetical protein